MASLAIENAAETRSILKPALLLMCGRTLAFAATFFIPVVLTRIFDPSQFGTYKQLFLIQSTVYFIAQFGMASSLYYFLPGAASDRGRYAANSTLFLGVAGAVSYGALVLGAPQLARAMNNASLPEYLPWLGLYSFFMMLSAPWEIVMIAEGRYLWASASYALSDLSRAAAFLLPALLSRQLDSVLEAAVVVAALRAAGTLLYFRWEFRGKFQPDLRFLKRQLAYAIPFGLAVLVEIVQSSLPQYAVSHMFNPAILAVFAIGCLQVPLVDFAVSPTSDVMMTKMQENLANGRKQAVLAIWHDAAWKLALLFFPLTAFLMVMARDVIVLLFTQKYLASVPLFMAWTLTIALSTLQVDGVLRVFAQTRFLLMLNLMRLAIIAGLIRWSLSTFHLIGAVLVVLLATLAFKVAALIRIKTLLEVSSARLLPWRNLSSLLAVAAGSAGVALAVKSQIHGSEIRLLLVTSVVFAAAYIVSVWKFDLLSSVERLAVMGGIRKSLFYITHVFTGRGRPPCAELPES